MLRHMLRVLRHISPRKRPMQAYTSGFFRLIERRQDDSRANRIVLRRGPEAVGTRRRRDRASASGRARFEAPADTCRTARSGARLGPAGRMPGLKSIWRGSRDQHADFFIVCAHGTWLAQSVMDVPGRGRCLNLHFSDLPRWRGAAPLERALEAGDTSTAVCLMQMVSELDAGPIYARTRVTH